MTRARISSKHQIVIPREARERLSVVGGDSVYIVPKGNVVLLLRAPESHTKELRGALGPKKGKLGRKLLDGIRKNRKHW